MTTTEPYVPPQNLEAEESVLGAMMVSETAVVSGVVDVHLRPEDFYRHGHGVIFGAIHVLHERNEPVDSLSVVEQLVQKGQLEEAGGKDMVQSLPETVPVPGNAEHYARIVKANAMLRRLLQTSQRIQKSVHERTDEPRDLVEQAEKWMFEVAYDTASQDFESISDILVRETSRLEELSTGKRDLTGTPSGFHDLDKITGGFQPGNLVIVAARPAMGKSSFVGNIADSVAVEKGMPVAFFSLEMSDTELAHRFIACRASIRGDLLRKGQVKSKWKQVLKASNQLEGAPIWIDTSSDLSSLELRAKARRLHATEQANGGLGLIIVDYIQLMRPDDPRQSRVEQVGAISRGLKLLAGELNVPVLGLSQLSRAPELRPDKRPILSDLRESGCLTGDSLVYLPDEGRYERIDRLVGKSGFRVLAIDERTGRLEPRPVERAFATGTKPVSRLRTQLGRKIRATANHRFLTLAGWKRLDELEEGDRIALPRALPGPEHDTLTRAELALLGLLTGDGCAPPRHAIQYTTNEKRLARLACDLATEVFGSTVSPRFQAYLPSATRLARGKRNPIAAWLDEMGAFGLRSHEKRVPAPVFAQSPEGVAHFLRHLWATDGSVWLRRGPSQKGSSPRVYFATSSEGLARDVQALLLRLGINARNLVASTCRGRAQHHVTVTGGADLRAFMTSVGGLGANKEEQASAILGWLDTRAENTDRDLIPRELWAQEVKLALAASGMAARELQAGMGMDYKHGLSRGRTARVARVLGHPNSPSLATSDVYWDQVAAIEANGREQVYDLTVQGLHSFVANEIVVHNSIEQDADVVCFLFREDYYLREDEITDEVKDKAEVIVAKHRNGPIGKVELAFQPPYPRFRNISHRQDRSPVPSRESFEPAGDAFDDDDDDEF